MEMLKIAERRIIGEYDFVDLGFADAEGNIWVKTCLHEAMLDLELSPKMLAEFEQLGIAYTL